MLRTLEIEFEDDAVSVLRERAPLPGDQGAHRFAARAMAHLHGVTQSHQEAAVDRSLALRDVEQT